METNVFHSPFDFQILNPSYFSLDEAGPHSSTRSKMAQPFGIGLGRLCIADGEL
jgi:hypothetical protein